MGLYEATRLCSLWSTGELTKMIKLTTQYEGKSGKATTGNSVVWRPNHGSWSVWGRWSLSVCIATIFRSDHRIQMMQFWDNPAPYIYIYIFIFARSPHSPATCFCKKLGFFPTMIIKSFFLARLSFGGRWGWNTRAAGRPVCSVTKGRLRGLSRILRGRSTRWLTRALPCHFTLFYLYHITERQTHIQYMCVQKCVWDVSPCVFSCCTAQISSLSLQSFHSYRRVWFSIKARAQ